MELVLLDTLDVGGKTQDNYLRGSYIHLANDTDGVVAMTYAGGTLASVGNYNPSGDKYTGIYVDSNEVIYSAVRTGIGFGRIDVLTFNGTTYTLQDSVSFNCSLVNIRLWGDGTYIHVACGGDGIKAFQYTGGSITFKATRDDGDGYRDVYYADGFIFTAQDSGGFSAYSFNGTAYTLLDSVDDIPGLTHSIFWDGSRLHQRMTGLLRVFSFVANTFSLEETHVLTNETFQISGMWGASDLIFIADSDNLKLFTYDIGTTSYTLEDTHASGTIAYGVHGDPDNYVVLSNFESGIKLYSWPTEVSAGQIIMFT